MNNRKWLTLGAAALIMAGCGSEKKQETAPPPSAPAPSAVEKDLKIGGRAMVELIQPASSDTTKPHIVSVDILPGRGMNVLQIKGYIPGKGVTDLLFAPPPGEAAQLMNLTGPDENGSQSFRMGGAVLYPFANRIRGKLSPDRKTLTTKIAGKELTLVANSKGRLPTATPHAMHGLILARAMDDVKTDSTAAEASVTATLNGGNFDGHWLANSLLTITETLKQNAFVLKLTAKNAGTEDLPVGVAWHPYFTLPSGNREQARLHIPASDRTQVNNYDDVFPTGKLLTLANTPYNFSGPDGAALGKLFLDDCFVNLTKDAAGHAVIEIIDPAAHYGVRITGISPEISAFQVYAPVDKPFVVVEPQFNYADPYSPVWKGKDTHMVMVKPGGSVTYEAQVELFLP